jgi:hypothetical protein
MTPDAETLLRRARLGLDPTNVDRARIKRRLAVRLGVGAATSALSASTSVRAGAAAVAGAASATATKWIGALLVVGGLLGTGAAVVRSSHHSPAPAAPRPRVEVPAASSPAPDLPSSEVAPAPRAVPPATRAPSPATPASPPRLVPGRSAPASAIVPGPTTVAAEAELLREAEATLRAGDAPRALAFVNEHAASFPNGILAEEREAERIAVLCALGRAAQARETAAAFLRDHARSPLTVRVRESCASNTP